MAGVLRATIQFLFGGRSSARGAVRMIEQPAPAARVPQVRPARVARPAAASPEPLVRVLVIPQRSLPVLYWEIRGWRRVKHNVFMGYYKTRLGRCHGVVKWNSPSDFNFYIHDVPSRILDGPHGPCFVQVKPGKFRIHFAVRPPDINSGIFYVETLLQEAFERAAQW